MKKYTLLLLVTLLLQIANAQQSPWLVFYRQNWQLLNPAALNRYFYNRTTPEPPDRISFGIRSEAIKAKNAPKTGFLNFEVLYPEHRIRWGGQFFFDKTDAISYTGGAFNFAYLVTDPREKLKISLGIQPSLFAYQVNINKLVPEVAGDPLLGFYNKPRWDFDFGFGFFMKKDRGTAGRGLRSRRTPEWYLGLSAPNLILLAKRRNGGIFGGSERVPHINIIAGIFKDIGADAGLEMTCWLRAARSTRMVNTIANNSLLSMDVNLRYHFTGQLDKGLWAGVGIGTNAVGSLEAGYSDRKKYRYQLMISASGPLANQTNIWGRRGIGLETTLTVPFSPPEWARTHRR